MSVTVGMLEQWIPKILDVVPYDWRGTTFNNSEKVYIGREAFTQNLTNLILKKAETGADVTEEEIIALGNAEDYLRVASNLSTVLELFLGVKRGYSVSQTWTFASEVMPVVAVILMAKAPVHLYVGETEPSSWEGKLQVFSANFKTSFTVHGGSAKTHQGEVVLALESAVGDVDVDAVVGDNTLFIPNTTSVNPADVLLIRKRLATPLTTPVAVNKLRVLSGLDAHDDAPPDAKSLNELNAHLQILSGAEVNHSVPPVFFTAGLPAMASLYVSLANRGGANVCMCSTAYGGSSQLLDLLTERSALLKKHTFNIQGDANMVDSIRTALNKMSDASDLLATTILFVEIPTNPDMKVPELSHITGLVEDYKKKTRNDVVLVVDTTFSPHSQILLKMKNIAPELPAIAYASLSKSVSGGFTTGGVLVANHTESAISLLEEIRKTATNLDTTAKADQLRILVEHHVGVEDRLESAYKNAVVAASALVKAVKERTGYDMPIKFVTPAQAVDGFLSTTFSFNLPSPQGATEEVNAALAQRFVDLLCAHKQHFKPCVSFGQDNTLTYATVPATSTQGAIKAEDKAKQAVGGVQLVRISFPPRWEEEVVSKIFTEAVNAVY